MRPLPEITWPHGARVALSFTVDVDADTNLLGIDDGNATRRSRISETLFGIERGLPRIQALLRDLDIKASFYIPGLTAENHGPRLEWILEDGHDIGHHGYLHRPPGELNEDEQVRELEKGMKGLNESLGLFPILYRAPYWDVTDVTLSRLSGYGIVVDSSCMADDRPYLEAAGSGLILEFPVHWSLDDGPYFAWADGYASPSPPLSLSETWTTEIREADHGAHLTLTVEPGLSGRRHRLSQIREVLENSIEMGDVWIASHLQVHRHLIESDVIEGQSVRNE